MIGDVLGDTNANRRGKVFSLRLSDVDRVLLEQKAKIAEALMPYSYERRRGSLGAFVIWAALQWSDQAPTLPGIEGKKKRARKVVPRRRRRGNTKTSPASRHRKGKAKKKGGRK